MSFHACMVHYAWKARQARQHGIRPSPPVVGCGANKSPWPPARCFYCSCASGRSSITSEDPTRAAQVGVELKTCPGDAWRVCGPVYMRTVQSLSKVVERLRSCLVPKTVFLEGVPTPTTVTVVSQWLGGV